MFILKKGHQPGVYVPLRALFLVFNEHSVPGSGAVSYLYKNLIEPGHEKKLFY